ncbi:hypothetical protein ACJIZ3_004573 [Penstemon smallii]|uniref:Uncharacterized protein n=1 Tax=Penstemon smallii TaxID=265156 RepID=A0ABD3S2N8_9LAMI
MCITNKLDKNQNSVENDITGSGYQPESRLQIMTDPSTKLDCLTRKCIYRLPCYVTDMKCKPLEPLEEYKKRTLRHFLKRSVKQLNLYFEEFASVIGLLREAYDELDPVWREDDNKFLQLMMLDGCFILEVLRVSTRTSVSYDYAPTNHIFDVHENRDTVQLIIQDMLRLGNQVPMLVLDMLVAGEGGRNVVVASPIGLTSPHFLHFIEFKLILEAFFFPHPPSITGKCLHILDVHRKGLLLELLRHKPIHRKRINFHIIRRDRSLEGEDEGGPIPSATEVSEVGILFKRSRTGSMKEISFQGSGILIFPPIVVRITHVCWVQNTYVFFVKCLLNSAEDVSLLRSCGIIHDYVGSDEPVFRMFDMIRRKFVIVGFYKESSWAVLSVIAAFILFTLSTIQTLYTVLSYTHRN